MTRQEYVLAVLAAADGGPLTPVQAQKLFFLLDRKVPTAIGGARFDFQPYDYGPFDKAVYEEFRSLEVRGEVLIQPGPNVLRTYALTAEGLEHGKASLAQFPSPVAGYIQKLAAWVRGQSFASLVSAIYSEFPEMKARSVFRGAQ